MNVRPAMTALLSADLYGITSEEHSMGRRNVEVVSLMIEAGIKVVQYREKYKNMAEKYSECIELREITRQAGVAFIVNDYVDLAIMVDADGVHVGQDDLPVNRIRELVGQHMIIGLSTHSPEQARAATEMGVDYIGVGPVFATATKKDVCSPVGLGYLDYVVKNINIPFVAIGGIKEHNIDQVTGRGAHCVAMVTEIVGAEDIPAKVNRIRSILKGESTFR
ncbi:MAG: thiamine-phosphate pyrophosphorylase [Peptococcaceae bacterium BRH_c4b]|nr:MAG: thiamine-phosphate pyrophosphorylase [Peptococcaceae bacterium BRH_c4b]